MELRKLIMLGVAFLGVAGTTAVAISGQNMITGPETFATDGLSSKSKAFGDGITVSLDYDDDVEGYIGYIEGGSCTVNGGSGTYTDVTMYYFASQKDTFGVGNFLVTPEPSCAIRIELNGITKVSMSYTSSYVDKIDDNAYFDLLDFGGNSIEEIRYEDAEHRLPISNDNFEIYTHSGEPRAQTFYCALPGGITINSITFEWSC